MNPNAARRTRSMLRCQGDGVPGVFDHGAVEDDGEVALEDAHGLASRVAL
jgi:hypothetical protein